MTSRTLLLTALSLTNVLVNGKRWNVIHYNYCPTQITLVFTNSWPSTNPNFEYPPTSGNGGTSEAWFDSDGFQDYSTLITAVQGYSAQGEGSSVEFDLQGQYDITAINGWNYPIFIKAGLLNSADETDNYGHCTLAETNSYSQPKGNDYYSYDSGLTSWNRQGDDTQVPNHYCSPDNFDTYRIQTCGQDSGKQQYIFGTACGSQGCTSPSTGEQNSALGASELASSSKTTKPKHISKPTTTGSNKVLQSGSSK